MVALALELSICLFELIVLSVSCSRIQRSDTGSNPQPIGLESTQYIYAKYPISKDTFLLLLSIYEPRHVISNNVVF